MSQDSGSMEQADTMAIRVQAIRDRMAQACARVGRDVAEVTLLPVSKTFDVNAIREAVGLGFRRFGENKTQEIAQKAPLLADCNLEWVVIGHLQTNKAKDVARLAHELQSLDRIELAQALDRRLQGEGRSIDVLVQVKTSPEETKSGLEASGLIDFLRELSRFDTLRVQGLMTMAEHSQEEHAVRACFSTLRQLRDQARQEAIAGISLDRLSMGMSGDFEWAIEEGSTEIRVGSAIFGTRPPLIPTP
jgi:pyridoxal phosphate enzyme (YggS family)